MNLTLNIRKLEKTDLRLKIPMVTLSNDDIEIKLFHDAYQHHILGRIGKDWYEVDIRSIGQAVREFHEGSEDEHRPETPELENPE